jgi:cell division protein FtsQ
MRMSRAELPSARRRPNPPRRRPRSRLTPKRLRLAGAGLGGAVLLSAAVAAVSTGWLGARLDAIGRGLVGITADAGLKLETVLVEGRAQTRSAEILKAVQAERGSAMLAIDVAAAKARLEALPWIRKATVVRQLPSTLAVRIEERKAFALWQSGKRLALIDRDGTVILRDNVGRFAGRPLLVGEGAEQRAGEIVDLLATEPEFFRHVEAAVLVSGRRWNLRLKHGISVRLPEEGAEAAWHRLADLARKEAVLDRALTIIDLRIQDRVTVRLSPEAIEPAEEPGEST